MITAKTENEENVLEVMTEDYPQSPREWDNLGTMVCWHKRYGLGDEQPDANHKKWQENLAISLDDEVEEKLIDLEAGEKWLELYKEYGDDAIKHSKEAKEDIIDNALYEHTVMLPLYLLDHSGLSVNTTGFRSPWDSGPLGYVYATREDIFKEFNVDELTPETRKKVREILKGEAEIYDTYLRGAVHRFVIFEKCPECGKKGLFIESCEGFFDTDEADMIDHMKDYVTEEYRELFDDLEI